MKRTAISGWILALTLSAALMPLSADDKKANELLQSGLTKETIQGDLKGAITLYEQAVKEAGSNRPLAAKALLRLAAAYQKQGDVQARSVYERVVRDYADQPEAASEARSRLGEKAVAVEGPEGKIIAAVISLASSLNDQQRQITLFNRQGKVIGTVGDPGPNGTMTISPDGKRVALVRNGVIFVYDVKTQVAVKLTSGPVDNQPAWSADGKRIAYEHRAGTPSQSSGIYTTPSDGTGKHEFVSAISDLTLVSWSPDGQYLTYQQTGKTTGYDAWALPLTGVKPFPILQTRASDLGPRISPDGRYVSYRSDESGRNEVYVRAFNGAATDPDPPSTAEKWKISIDPGVATAGVRWRADGKEIYYLSAKGEMMAVSVTTTPTFKASAPKLLFQVPDAYQSAGNNTAGFSDVTADGQIFALLVPRK